MGNFCFKRKNIIESLPTKPKRINYFNSIEIRIKRQKSKDLIKQLVPSCFQNDDIQKRGQNITSSDDCHVICNGDGDYYGKYDVVSSEEDIYNIPINCHHVRNKEKHDITTLENIIKRNSYVVIILKGKFKTGQLITCNNNGKFTNIKERFVPNGKTVLYIWNNYGTIDYVYVGFFSNGVLKGNMKVYEYSVDYWLTYHWISDIEDLDICVENGF